MIDLLPDDADAEAAGERLSELLVRPVDINTATAAELTRIPFFDNFFIRNLLLQRSRQGHFKTLYDLKAVQGAPLAFLPYLTPFLTTVRPTYESETVLRQQIWGQVEAALPFGRDQYKGVGWGVRYDGAWGNRHQWSVRVEQDRGETLLPIRQGGVDYLSLSYQYRADQWSLHLGDFRVNSGLGHHLGQGRSYFSFAEMTGQAPKVDPHFFKSHRSFREYGFMRGAAAQWGVGAVNVGAFYGIEPMDARIERQRVVTLYYGGKHRTRAERQHRHRALRSNAGALLTYRQGGWEMGLSALLVRYRTPEWQPLSAYRLHPDRQLNRSAAFHFRYAQGAWLLTGESLMAPKSRISSTLALSYFNDYRGQWTVIGRYFGGDHYSPHGWGDTFYSNQRNEMGVKMIWSGELARWWQGLLYFDLFRKIEPEGGAGKAENGWAAMAKANYRYEGKSFRSRVKYTRTTTRPPRLSIRATYQRAIGNLWSMRVGGTLTHVGSDQSIRSAFGRVKYRSINGTGFEGGLQYFFADGGVVRADQPYMPLMYYAPMLRGRGWRATAVLQYQSSKVQYHLRASHYIYTQQPTSPLPSLLELSLSLPL